MNELALPGVEFDLNGTTLMLKGDKLDADAIQKVKDAIDNLGFSCSDKSA